MESLANDAKHETESLESKKVKVKGMTCNHCKQNVEEKLKSLDGIKDAYADLATGEVTISGNQLDLKEIKTGIETIGYEYWGESD